MSNIDLGLNFNTLLIVAVGVGFAISNYLSGRGKAQSETIGALQVQVTAQKDRIQDLEVQLAQASGKIESLEHANRLLEQLVRGIPDWNLLHKSLAQTGANIENLIDRYPTDYKEAQQRHVDETHALFEKLTEKRN